MYDEPTPVEQVLIEVLDRISKATSLVEVNVAAGIAHQDLLGIDVE